MREYQYTTSVPDPDDDGSPETCQVRGCDTLADKWVRFVNPKEYVVYCADHARDRKQSCEKSSRMGVLS